MKSIGNPHEHVDERIRTGKPLSRVIVEAVGAKLLDEAHLYWQEKSEGGKKVRSHNKYNHRLSRKGYAGLMDEISQQTGMNEEDIDRSLLWKKAREKKTGGYAQNVQTVVDKIEELQNSENHGEGASCQIWEDNEDFKDKPVEELLDNSCFLAVDVASNIVAKGTITKYGVSDETIEVMMDMCVKGEALLPIPLEEEFILKVKDAVGYILSWPRHLVIRCSDLVPV
ncbi:hypothetical protein L2E82_05748 [Cichorium intybus]|uniref:Uncharacterized protein n=2 Tax=Cichorium intybus TaxID=13427 RepID=A0ACB9H860_CICIN|nr:hypothetical protein L2E82_48895 [Cichorium intybus]KAI3791884.1 hypothetical protein L2E82_05748 [Cichorium intybus]